MQHKIGESIMGRILTAEQKRRRAETARKNGARSRGAKSEQTRSISSRNSTTHGCYAVVHSLPDEPLDFTVGLRQEWIDLKKPEDVEEGMLVEDMYRSNLMQIRLNRAMDSALQFQ